VSEQSFASAESELKFRTLSPSSKAYAFEFLRAREFLSSKFPGFGGEDFSIPLFPPFLPPSPLIAMQSAMMLCFPPKNTAKTLGETFRFARIAKGSVDYSVFSRNRLNAFLRRVCVFWSGIALIWAR
jgi:hypothetical protein